MRGLLGFLSRSFFSFQSTSIHDFLSAVQRLCFSCQCPPMSNVWDIYLFYSLPYQGHMFTLILFLTVIGTMPVSSLMTRVLMCHSASSLGGLHFPRTLTFLKWRPTLLWAFWELHYSCDRPSVESQAFIKSSSAPKCGSQGRLFCWLKGQEAEMWCQSLPQIPCLAKPCSFPLNTFLCQEGFSTPGFAHAGRTCTTLGGYAICLNMRQVRMTSTFTKFLAALRK